VKSYQQLFAELKRRNVFKVAGVYGVVAFVLLQVADLLGQGLRLPESFMPFITAVILLGFPLALILAWAFEVTPDGVQRTPVAAPGEIERIVAAPASKRWPAGLLALAGAGALLGGAWWAGTRMGPGDSAGAAAAGETRPDSLQLAFVEPEADARPSIAVLPFADMSPEGDQAYFSDGITEEILNTLAKVRELKVAARTSAFAFRGRELDMRAIGDSLGVAYLMEGSVRKAGDRLRITAQLIDAADGTHLWSESYDRTMDDVFAIQTEIAEAIAGELRVPLGLDDPGELVTPTADLEAYDLYLAGRARMRERYEALGEAVRLFEAAVARDSSWAPAWAGLAEALELTSWYDDAWDEVPDGAAAYRQAVMELMQRSERAAQRALALDPGNSSAHVALGSVYRNRHDWEASEASYLRALASDPDNPEAHQQYAEMLLDVGRVAEGRRSAERAVRLDAAPVRMVWHANGLELDGFVREAVEATEAGLSEFPGYVDLQIGLFYRYSLYPDVIARTRSESRVADSIRVEAERLREGDLTVTVPYLERELPYFWMAAGRRDSAIVRLAAVAEAHMTPAFIWMPAMDPLRAEPEYGRMLRELNLEGATPQRTPRDERPAP
jgi:TolB-like protein